MAPSLVDELSDWLRIPSVSADPARAGDVRGAGEWLCELVRGGGGHAELVDWEGHPLAGGELRAADDPASAPTVLVYGHFDVQPPGPLELWDSDPFEPTVRDGWLYARGVADDKGPLYTLVKGATTLAAERALPVNVRIACDGEEETGGHSIVDWVEADDRGADAALIFDSPMVARDLPAFVLATRGVLYFHVAVRTADADLHSGLYGGAALNATHALMQVLSAVLPRAGRLPEPLRAGVRPPSDEERADWSRLPPGADELAGQGGRQADREAGEEFYVRTWAEPSLDVHGLVAGEPRLQKTIVPAFAEATVSIRTVPGQDVDDVTAAFRKLLHDAAPAGADVTVERWSASRPAVVPGDSRPVALALDAFERSFGSRPLVTRTGGSLPIVAALADKGIPTVVTGLALPDSNFHAPNERLPVDYVERGVEAAREVYVALAALRSGSSSSQPRP